ncbi:copper resistance protein CopC [Streptosporangium sp. NPDC006007]|uniref:copper resistance CopC family protein n=1 Tax=Streptosporangium sp. NPDC006007 TaxID=3154575 RepID=UPI0033ADEF41
MAHLPRFMYRTVLATLCCGLFLMLTAPAALAHDRLKSSSPAMDAKVSSIERIELEFTAQVRFPAIALREAAGTLVTVGKPHADGAKVTSKIIGVLPPGKYVAAWRVVSSDGHPIEGEIPFTLTGPATPSSTPTASTAPAAPPTSPAASPAAPAAPASPVPVSATGDQNTSGGVPGLIWGGLAALVVIGLAVLLRRRRTHRPRTTGTE